MEYDSIIYLLIFDPADLAKIIATPRSHAIQKSPRHFPLRRSKSVAVGSPYMKEAALEGTRHPVYTCFVPPAPCHRRRGGPRSLLTRRCDRVKRRCPPPSYPPAPRIGRSGFRINASFVQVDPAVWQKTRRRATSSLFATARFAAAKIPARQRYEY